MKIRKSVNLMHGQPKEGGKVVKATGKEHDLSSYVVSGLVGVDMCVKRLERKEFTVIKMWIMRTYIRVLAVWTEGSKEDTDVDDFILWITN